MCLSQLEEKKTEVEISLRRSTCGLGLWLLTNKANSYGDKFSPCLTPIVQGKSSVNLSPNITVDFASEYRLYIARSIGPFIPLF